MINKQQAYEMILDLEADKHFRRKTENNDDWWYCGYDKKPYGLANAYYLFLVRHELAWWQ